MSIGDNVDNILVFNHDIRMYPPILSVIERLLASGQSVVLAGYCSDAGLVASLEKKGVVYEEVIRNRLADNPLLKLTKLFSYRRKVKSLTARSASRDTLLWIFGNENVWVLHSLVARHKTVIYLFEVPQFTISARYKLLTAFADYGELMRSAYKVVCCEYNRAHITRSFFGLEELPVVIPNKPEIAGNVHFNLSSTALATETRKVLLYQGIFNFPERRLEALCESISYLPDDYVVVLMGPDSEYKNRLRSAYESERVRFVAFISPPYHLSITSGAFIGFLNYFSIPGDLNAGLNTLYCAPNKVFEYSKFGVPMIGNDGPALRAILEGNNAGVCVEGMSPRAIAEAVQAIGNDYSSYQEGSRRLYESVDFGGLIDSIARRGDGGQLQAS